ncbi:MAG: ABC transporter permease [Planctomycetota bacterium]|nr:MAG: ABC transporter permease [Planctomycetota bacterium]
MFLSIAAVGLSTSVLIVVASLFGGFINVLERSAIDAMGDVVLSPPSKFAKYELLIETLEQTGEVKAATAMLSATGLLHLGKGNVRAVSILGIEPERRAKVTGFKRSLIEQSESARAPSFEVADFPERIGGFVGIGVIAEPDEKTDEYDFGEIRKMVGQQVVLTTGAVLGLQEDKGTTAQVKRKTVKFTISDIVFTGVYDLDKRFVYLGIEQLQKILYPNEDTQVADRIQIKLKSGAETEVALAEIRGVWQSFASDQLGWSAYMIRQTDIATAQELQSQYIAELLKQMGVLLLIFGVVSLSVVLLILCIFYMIVMTKQRDIAIMKSCGTTSSTVALIFVGFGAFVGIIGSGIGVIAGYIVTKNINTIEEWIRIIFGLKLWKSSVYMFSKIPSEVDWVSALTIVLLAVAAACLGVLIPSVVAARTRPVEILRYE